MKKYHVKGGRITAQAYLFSDACRKPLEFKIASATKSRWYFTNAH